VNLLPSVGISDFASSALSGHKLANDAISNSSKFLFVSNERTSLTAFFVWGNKMASRGPQEEEDAAELKLGTDFAVAQCLLNSEVAILLETSQQAHEADESEAELSQVFIKTLGYVKTFSRYKNKTAVKEVRSLLTKRNLEEFEIASLANLCPESAEEAKSLIPTLGSKFTDDDLEMVLSDLRNYSSF